MCGGRCGEETRFKGPTGLLLRLTCSPNGVPHRPLQWVGPQQHRDGRIGARQAPPGFHHLVPEGAIFGASRAPARRAGGHAGRIVLVIEPRFPTGDGVVHGREHQRGGFPAAESGAKART